MSTSGKWVTSGEAILTKYQPLTSQDGENSDVEFEGREAETSYHDSQPTRSQRNKPANQLDVYTVEEAVDKMGFGVFQILLCLFAGSIWVVEAFEVMILAILSAAVKCEWNLSYAEEATISTVVFFGFLVGSPVWGVIADKYGRKTALFIVELFGFVFGVVSAFSPEYYTLLLFRGLVGFGLGGGFLGPAYCVEFLPARSRAVVICLIQVAWAVGSVMEALLALVVMTSIDHEPWRWLLGLSAIPLLIVLLVFPLVPESPRFLIYRGKEEKAKKVLALIARINCKQLPEGRLVAEEEKERMVKEYSPPLDDVVESILLSSGHKNDVGFGTLPSMEASQKSDLSMIASYHESERELLLGERPQRRRLSCLCIQETISDYYHWTLILFKNGWWKTTLLLWYLWFAANVVYYGGALLTTALFQQDSHCGLKNNDTDDGTCKPLSKSDYIHLVWTTGAEFPGTIWIIVLLLLIGRKKSMALTTLAAGVCYGLLFICLNKTVLTVFLFGVRGFATGFFQAIYLYTPEVYPTAVRAFGMSLCASVSRIGAMIAPYIAQTLLAYNFSVTISLFIGCSVLSSLASLLLPIETRGRAMKDTG